MKKVMTVSLLAIALCGCTSVYKAIDTAESIPKDVWIEARIITAWAQNTLTNTSKTAHDVVVSPIGNAAK